MLLPRTVKGLTMPAYAPSVPALPAPANSSIRPLVVFLTRPDGTTVPAPFLMDHDDVADLFRLRVSGCRFYRASINRYRGLGLRSARIGRRVWFRLDDAVAFLGCQQDRLAAS